MLPEFQIDCAMFIDALAIIGRASARRAINPSIHNKVLLRAYDQSVTIIATNGSMEAWAQLPATVKQEGGCIIEYEGVRGLLDKIDGQLSVKPKDNRMEFKCGKAKMSAAWIDQEEFPEAVNSDGASLTMPFSQFEGLVKRAGFAFEKVEAFPVLMGVHFHSVNGTAYIGSTDKFYLAQESFDSQGKGFNALPDGAHLRDAVSMLTNASGDLEIRFGRSHTHLFRGLWGISVPNIDGEYPKITEFLARRGEMRFTASRAEFLDALRRVRITAADGDAMHLKSDGNKVTLRSEGGNSDAVIEVDAKTRDAHEVILSDNYLFRVLTQFPEEVFTFENDSSISPIFIKSGNLSYAVMPINRKPK